MIIAYNQVPGIQIVAFEAHQVWSRIWHQIIADPCAPMKLGVWKETMEDTPRSKVLEFTWIYSMGKE